MSTSRWRRALRTNEPQVGAVVLFTGLNALVLLRHEGPVPWWLWVTALGLWPAVALLANAIEPLP